ncbi:hypothetical protein BCF33_1846 [Hasllibacter halocynthiae]|uniref:Uncharacterized protein n=1 Tax=Hasllibacter halocynthiae TaxID=595589 RepID=A0A2T0X205_9RHOB|nr:hypothetical protein BCF33_1846 [Hasllibacter halocynthiae]
MELTALIAWGILLLIPIVGLVMASKGARDHDGGVRRRDR